MTCRTTQWIGLPVLVLGLLAGTSCKDNSPKTAPETGGKPAETTAGVHGHSHERDKSLLEDAGKYHARLTAHLSSKEGNELDVFFETTDKDDPRPVAIPLESFTAQARAWEGELKELKFECAPADERPKGEKSGTCSHFVAKVPWMKPTDKLYVMAKIKLDGEDVTIRWRDFNPKKYAHNED